MRPATAASRPPALPARLTLVAGLLAAVSGAHAALPPEVFSTRMTFSAYVKEDWLPGPTLYENSQVVFDAPSDANPPQQVDLLRIARGVNWSGHSTDIPQAFASSTAQSDGAGGVGVTQTVFTQPDAPYQQSVFHLAAQSLWTQTFTNLGTLSFDLSVRLSMPELTVGLIDVPPNRSGPSATQTASAVARWDTVITRADGSIVHGGGFALGLQMHEVQFLLGPGTYSNFYDLTITAEGGVPQSANLSCNDVAGQFNYNPRCGFGALAFDVSMGRLNPGDTMSYVYTLSASGTTEGSEQGFMAFIGDPFHVDAAGGGLAPTASSPVPEPRPAWLLAAGLVLLGLRRRPYS